MLFLWPRTAQQLFVLLETRIKNISCRWKNKKCGAVAKELEVGINMEYKKKGISYSCKFQISLLWDFTLKDIVETKDMFLFKGVLLSLLFWLFYINGHKGGSVRGCSELFPEKQLKRVEKSLNEFGELS